ncbi:MAG: CCA tRNA nucleotidyltransferase, partial [Treponema sp.]|nr:CCA tRNA nucleotidyltransferase [Treponema sp.]
MNCIKIHSDLRKVGKIFSEHGFKAYLVGGAVRDAIMKKEESDWDIATNATPQEVCSIFRKVIPTGIAHGTVTIHIFGREIETTTFRTESDYSDGRHPDKVAYAATIEEDLSRRDFTMNAIAASLETGELIDPYGGITDIQ